mmetsp:Transcript_23655/g.36507  ORF Transcript_23655/g.36507 Transcript_23655/m.36507 type:complete len:180 (-) Transcript_23655:166-705(-)
MKQMNIILTASFIIASSLLRSGFIATAQQHDILPPTRTGKSRIRGGLGLVRQDYLATDRAEEKQTPSLAIDGSLSEAEEQCVDEKDFRDCNGFDCAWYSAERNDDFYMTFYDEADTRCFMWGWCAHIVTGRTANEACCECGGGSTASSNIPPSVAPSVTLVSDTDEEFQSFDASSSTER